MPAGIKDKSLETVCRVHAPHDSLDQIVAQAESGELVLELSSFESLTLFKEAKSHYDKFCLFRDQTIALDRTSQSVRMVSDKGLLSLVIGQMIENVMEASPVGQTINAGCFVEQNCCTFWVLNKAVIPESAQQNICNRDFSTKSQTRGLGTYGIKLLTQTYLKGQITFTSQPDPGTIVRATFPLEL